MAAAIPLAIGAVAGGINSAEEQRATERFNKGAAEANRFADVTGRFTELRKAGPGAFGGAIKGAASFAPLAAGGAFGGTSGVQDVGGLNFISGGQQSPAQFNVGGFGGTQGNIGAFNALGRRTS